MVSLFENIIKDNFFQGLGKISKLELKHKWDGSGETKGYGYVRFADKDVENQVIGGGKQEKQL